MKLTLDTNFLISDTQWDNSVAHKLFILVQKKDLNDAGFTCTIFVFKKK